MIGAFVALTALLSSSAPLEACRLDHPAGLRLSARCGAISVPEGQHTIAVGFAVLSSTSAEPGLPLVLLAGGPGQSATRDFVALGPVLERLRMDRDVVLVDARGTGRSTPLRCKDDRSFADKVAGVGDAALLNACMAGLPVDPALLTTANVVADLERVRTALSIERWHVLGVSYGTRVAAAYAVASPQAVASLVLDGVAPLDRALGDDIATDMEASLRALGPGVVADLVAVKAALKATPVPVTLAHPTTGKPTSFTVTADVVNGVVRMALYADETRAIIPDLLRRAVLGDLVGLAALASSTVDTMEGTIHTPVNVAVLCAEDVPFLATTAHAADAVFNDERSSMKGSCDGIAPVTKPFRPTSIAAPTLLLSGEFDPITPPRHAQRAEGLFTVKRHLIVRGHGHNMLPRGCMPRVVADTLVALEAGKAIDSVDVACLDRVQAFPVFVDAMGPSP